MPPLIFIAIRQLRQSRVRTTLSALAVGLGVAVTVAANFVGRAFRNSLSQADDVQTILVGLLDQLDRMLLLVGLMVTGAAGFLIFNAFAMTVTQRQKQLGALRSLGMTRRQVMGLVLVEALIVGGLGTLLGLVVGPLLGWGVYALFRAFDVTFNVSGQGVIAPASLLLAASLGLGVTLLSVSIPAWRAARISPLLALRPEARAGMAGSPKGWALLGGGVILLLGGYLAVAPPGEWVMPPWDNLLTGLFALAWLLALGLLLPALIGGAANWGGRALSRFGATGRLVADNLGRERRRVVLTVATLAVGLTMIVGMTGFITFWLRGLFGPIVERAVKPGTWTVYTFDYTAGLGAYGQLDSLQISPESGAAVREALVDQAEVMDIHFVVVPELSFLGGSYFSMVLDPHLLRQSGDALFSFTEGDWETAMPIMERGCGLLVTPLVARNNGAGLGGTIWVQGSDGPVPCTVAGIGPTLVYASIISSAAAESFGLQQPIGLYVFPQPGADPAQIEARLLGLAERHPDLWPHRLEELVETQYAGFDTITSMFNGMLLLTILAAALGVVNTTFMSVTERRRELGLLRAVGATRRQVRAVVVGEAALMGLLGGGMGLVAGVGFTLIVATVFGGNAVGVRDLALWPTAWRAVQPALLTGFLGLMAAPFICGAAAWLPIRALLRQSVVGSLQLD